MTTIAIIGGTGHEGSGLAFRWAAGGHRVIIGSREGAKAAEKAAEINAELAGKATYAVEGMGNEEAVKAADLAVLTVPYRAHQSTLESLRELLQGKIMIDVTVPLKPPQFRTVNIPEGKSAAQEAQAILGEGVKVVSAFQNVSHVLLKNLEKSPTCDVLVTGDDETAKATVIALVADLGMRGIDAGLLANAVAAEALTAVILYINNKYKVSSSGVVITGLKN
jgi:8-hydroxy-5-deazaflavin:NADPH oxidoreductase